MKTEHDRIKKVLSASLLIVYFFVALTYIQFLPNYTVHRLNNGTYHANHLTAGAYGNGSRSHAVLQNFFKAAPENKRDLAAGFLGAALLIGLMVAAAFVAWQLISRQTNSLVVVTQRHVYLQYRSLRI